MAECFREESCFLMKLFGLLLLLRAGVDGAIVDVSREYVLVKQSKTLDNQEAEFAVNKDPNDCVKADYDAVWKLDLGQNRMISSVQIRGPGSYDVHISDNEASFSIDAEVLGSVCRFGVSDAEGTCYSPVFGRYVSIRTEQGRRGYLQFCDVNLYECEDGYFGKNCTFRCRCRDNDLCAKDSGTCPNGCEAGRMGPSCQQECPDNTWGYNCVSDCHCQYGRCNVGDGACSSDCANGWLGTDCQTAIPYLKTAPTVNTKTASSIELMWPAWTGYMGIGYTLHYKVLFRERGYREWDIAEAQVPHQSEDRNNFYKVKHLKLNTPYSFKIQPVIQGPGTEDLELDESPSREWIKTDCAEPETPIDVGATKGPDMIFANGASATMVIMWKPIPAELVNCDSMWYSINYRPRSDDPSIPWKATRAQQSSINSTLESLDFDTEYQIKVAAVNNRQFISSYVEFVFKTGAAPPISSLAYTNKGETNFTYIIIGIVAGCVAIVIVVSIVVVYRRRKAKKYSAVPVKEDEENTKLNSMVKDDSGLGGEGSSGSTPTAEILEPVTAKILPVSPPDIPPRPDLLPDEPVPQATEHEPIPLDVLEEYVIRGRENDCADLIKEYREIQEGFTDVHDWGKREENKHKNRFINIIAYDHSRVILDKIEGDPDSDYVNANYIDGYKRPKAFIASQGCTKYTIQDMWRMVWQVNSRRIVMVTNLVENGKRKCEQYWPDHDNVEKFYGDVGVTVLDTEQTSDFIIRTFNIRKGDEHRNIKQFHFTAWPDHGVPNRASPIIHFRRKIRSFDESHPGLVTVHCSAGVGRTGTYIALDYLLDQAVAESIVDVYNLTLRMRKDRVNMIQTVEQYIFVYDALLEALKCGNTVIPCHQFREEYEALCYIDPDKGKSKLEEQYEKLQSMSPKVKMSDCGSGQLAENENKNRFPDILPADRYRPYLMTRVQGTNDYINAVFLDGYKSKNAYILTQMPLPHTVIDLWRMIHEHKCGSIVMLNPWDEDEPTYGQYWPGENQECECGPYVIESCSIEESNPNIIVRELKLQYTPESPKLGGGSEQEVRKVNHFQLKCWPRDANKPHFTSALIGLIDLVERSQLKTGNGPIVIHCHDGVKQSGLYAAVSSMWEKMKVEQEVDIFHTVKYLRFHRPQVINNLEQYQFSFDMVLAYLAEFEIYANFR